VGMNQQTGAVALGMPAIGTPQRSFGTGYDLAPKPMKVVLNWGRKYSLWVFNFGLACCAIEFIAASMARHDFIRLGVIPFAPGPRQADLMVVSGTVSDKMAPAVKRLYEQMPEPKYVISFGACANCGGPYWDSYSVTKGIDQVIPVDVYVPGCPPRPEALLQGIIKLQEKIAAEGGATPVAKRRLKPPPVAPYAIAPPRAIATTAIASPRAIAPTSVARPAAPQPLTLPPAGQPAPPSPSVQPAAPSPVRDAAPDPRELAEPVPKVRVPRRHYFRELRRARDHGLSLFDKAAHDQEWEFEDER
jgi:NADH-quinone oxidoreductase subunit B